MGDCKAMGKTIEHFCGVMTRLRKNQAGNTLAMVAAGIIPLLGLVGGGIDMSRLYLTKARLQQACDAGSLAGRKEMGAGAWTANSNNPNKVALELFDANFGSNPYGTSGTTRAFTESAGKVTGTASVVVPMTIMKIFGQTSKTVAVSCDAEMRIPNTDVMFVLDTTGSMNDTIPGDTSKKIDGLKKAVKCFYEALAKIDIDNVDCGSTPSGGNSNTVQLRFGFVPYAVNVNVGKLLNNDWMVNEAKYQTRYPLWNTTTTNQVTPGTPTMTSSSVSTSGSQSGWNSLPNQSTASEADCLALVPADGFVATGTESEPQNISTSGNTTTWNTTQSGEQRDYEMRDWRSRDGRCRIRYKETEATLTRYYSRTDTVTSVTTTTFGGWRYNNDVALDVRGLKAGGYSWNSSVSLPIGNDGTSTSIAWDGCIEERKAYKNTDGDPSNDYSPIPSNAWDMDIDMVPTSDDDTRWKPLLPDAVWGRVDPAASWNWTQSEARITGPWNYWNGSYWESMTINDMPRNRSYYCPRPARKLSIYKTASEVTDFKNYVDAFTPDGNTYHDIGLIWGARLMSPTGLFASENALTPNGGTIERHMIFMTDGASVASNSNYTAYGVPWWDRRQATSTNSTVLKSTIDARLTALCSTIKNKNITLWVIYYGAAGSDDATRLTNCASSGRFYNATNSTSLINQFKAIADEISQLRLTS